MTTSAFNKIAMSAFRDRLSKLGYDSELVKSAFTASEMGSGAQALYNQMTTGDPTNRPDMPFDRARFLHRRTFGTTKKMFGHMAAGEWGKAQSSAGRVYRRAKKGVGTTLGQVQGLFAAGNIAGQVSRARRPNEGFFESLGRRTGNVGDTMMDFIPGAGQASRGLRLARKARHYKTLGQYGQIAGDLGGSKALSTVGRFVAGIPTLGDVGGFAGKTIDRSISAGKSLVMSGRKSLGGGKSQTQKMLEAVDKRRTPKKQLGDEYVVKADYQK
jgi:hypothetical protein